MHQDETATVEVGKGRLAVGAVVFTALAVIASPVWSADAVVTTGATSPDNAVVPVELAPTTQHGAREKASPDAPHVIYHNFCSVCHGEKGDGQSLARFVLEPPPVDFTSDEVRKELSRAHMIEVLNKGAQTKEGKPTAMVAWKSQLSRKHIETVVDYVIVRFMDGKTAPNEAHPKGMEHAGHDHSAANVKKADYPYGLKPNAARGKTVYSANCVLCHGAKGDGRGNLALTGANTPRNFHDPDFLEFANGFSLFSAVTRGKGHMPGWDKTLSNQDVADVSEYILRTFVKRSRAKQGAK